MNLKKDKNNQSAKKLVDILKNQDESKEEFYICDKATQGENNSRIEMAELQKLVYEQEKSVKNIMLSDNFSLSKLYEAATKLTLLEKKLAWFKDKFDELF